MTDITLTWKLPTQRSKTGAPLSIREIDGVEIEISADKGQNWSVLNPLVPATTTQLFVPELEDGSWMFRGTVIDTRGARSEALEVKVITNETSPPMALAGMAARIS
jgi:hypothetical protein